MVGLVGIGIVALGIPPMIDNIKEIQAYHGAPLCGQDSDTSRCIVIYDAIIQRVEKLSGVEGEPAGYTVTLQIVGASTSVETNLAWSQRPPEVDAAAKVYVWRSNIVGVGDPGRDGYRTTTLTPSNDYPDFHAYLLLLGIWLTVWCVFALASKWLYGWGLLFGTLAGFVVAFSAVGGTVIFALLALIGNPYICWAIVTPVAIAAAIGTGIVLRILD